jgi:cysteine-S-conjugate beta-lyase
MNQNFFDEIHNRKNTMSMKWDTHRSQGIPEDAYPLWVADMDFQTLPKITETLRTYIESGIYGYSFESPSYFQSIIDWLKRRHQYEVDRAWILTTPGVVSAINAAILAFTHEQDVILIQEPVYYPFKRSILFNQRSVESNDLILNEGHYSIDFNDFESKIRDHKVKLFVLCNPHNPVGRVFSEVELNKMVDICKKYDVLIISDEVHMDFVYEPHRHFVLAQLRQDYADHIITLTAASKTFNLAAMKVSQAISSNKDLIEGMRKMYQSLGLYHHNTIGLKATEIAFTFGDDYVDALVQYLKLNIEYLNQELIEHCPKIKMVEAQSLYIVWLDFSAYNLSQDVLKQKVLNEAKLWLNDGSIFGSGGEGFMRLNLALPFSELKKVTQQLIEAFKD